MKRHISRKKVYFCVCDIVAIVVQQLFTVSSVYVYVSPMVPRPHSIGSENGRKKKAKAQKIRKESERAREKSNKPNDFGSCLLVKHKKCAPLPQPINITINSPFERNKPLLCRSFLIKFNVNTENMVMSGDTSKSNIIHSRSTRSRCSVLWSIFQLLKTMRIVWVSQGITQQHTNDFELICNKLAVHIPPAFLSITKFH